MRRPPLLVVIVIAAVMTTFKMYARHLLRPLKPFQTLFPWFPLPEEYDPNETPEQRELRLKLAARSALEAEWDKAPQPQCRLFTDDDFCVSYKPIYLAIRGEVFNVTRGEGFYGTQGGYQNLARTDNSMGFTDLALTASHDPNWTHTEVDVIESWREQYHKDYIFVGRHVGAYYDEYGLEIPAIHRAYKSKLKEHKYVMKIQKQHRQIYPPCNGRSTSSESKSYCSLKNGGKPLKDGSPDWVGYPRRILRPHSDTWECACIRDLDTHDIEPDRIRLFKVHNENEDTPPIYCGIKESECIWDPRVTKQDP